MNLTFAKRDIWNTQILKDDDVDPLYETNTEDTTLLIRGRETVLFRVGADGSQYRIAQVIVGFELGGRKSVMVAGQEIVPTPYTLFNKNQSFIASNGQKYTWRVKGDTFVQLLQGVGANQSKETIVELLDSRNNSVVQVYEASWDTKKNQPTTRLALSSEVVGITDEIVALYIYMCGQKEKRDRAKMKQIV
ncbi:hypothetical protein DL96DRAFT_1614479 [Flagelloscypha sp. PMI_526]|nr:hypothetical protein DL96DRAFT_1614479 [Flagelloscypha sp. PMI_526]